VFYFLLQLKANLETWFYSIAPGKISRIENKLSLLIQNAKNKYRRIPCIFIHNSWERRQHTSCAKCLCNQFSPLLPACSIEKHRTADARACRVLLMKTTQKQINISTHSGLGSRANWESAGSRGRVHAFSPGARGLTSESSTHSTYMHESERESRIFVQRGDLLLAPCEKRHATRSTICYFALTI
jgi:hypothetical protein